MADDTSFLPAERLRLLVEQVAREVGQHRGWQSEVARRIGVHRSYVSKIAKGAAVSVGTAVVEKVCETMGLERSFFYDPMPEPPDYQHFLRDVRRRRRKLLDLDLIGGEDWERLYWAAFRVIQAVYVEDDTITMPRVVLRDLWSAMQNAPLVRTVHDLGAAPDGALTPLEVSAALSVARDIMGLVLVWMSLNDVQRPGLPMWPPDRVAELFRRLSVHEPEK